MRFVALNMLQSNDTILVPDAPTVVAGLPIGVGFRLVQIVTIDPAAEEFGFNVRIGGTDLVTNLPTVVDVVPGTIMLSPDQGEILLS